MMPQIFSTFDPRGRLVICTEECWNFHILDGHPELDGQEELVKKAIEQPSLPFIYQDKDYQDRHVYYSLDDSGEYYLKVIAEFLNDEYGEVITAFWTDSIRPGEKMIWPNSED
jgi:hypothetical protein